ncbi:hypothetical protein FRC10_004366 [Ceratobasidium sp. 414]|nr:hypothetical protein FRC10_004366 [Ceratobasidium sp. 414]
MSDDHEPQAPEGFLDTLEGEIALFRSIERARPVGMHKHFHMLTLRRSIRSESGVWVDVAAVWAKLATMYHLDALDDMDDQQFDSTTGRIILYPNTTDPGVLYNHPYFREFALPYSQFSDLMTARRAASPSGENDQSKPRKRHLNAGLTNDDSELSDLTEGDDDGETDAATEPAEDGAEEEGGAEAEDAPTSRRGTRKGSTRGKVPAKGSRGKGTKKKKSSCLSIVLLHLSQCRLHVIGYIVRPEGIHPSLLDSGLLLMCTSAHIIPFYRQLHSPNRLLDTTTMLPNLPCTISKPSGNLLTMEDGDEGAHLIIVHPTGNPGEQEPGVGHRTPI